MSLMKQIEEKDALIKQYHKQLEKIQERLNITMLTLKQRMELETEVSVIKDELNKLELANGNLLQYEEKELKGLQKENFRSLMLVGILLLFIFLIYYFFSPV